MRVRLSALALAALLVALPATAAGRQWIGGRHDGGAWLVYGTRETDDVVVAFGCDAAAGTVAVSFPHEPVGAQDGMALGLELFSAGGTLALQATGHRLELGDGFLLEAETRQAATLRRILGQGETLSVMVQDGVEELPLAGASAAGEALFEACS